MSGPLALVGGDEFSTGCDFDAELIAAVGADQVAVLPTGSAYENPGKVIDLARGWFADLGVEVVPVPVYTRPDAMVSEYVEAVASARLIYLTGTSPMHMRSVLKDTPVLDAICAAWHGGAALVGSGAGADVLCDPMVDTRGGAFTVGLGIIPLLAVIARSNLWSPDKIHRTVEMVPRGVSLVELPERTAMILGGDSGWRSAGVGHLVVHQAGGSAELADLPRPLTVD